MPTNHRAALMTLAVLQKKKRFTHHSPTALWKYSHTCNRPQLPTERSFCCQMRGLSCLLQGTFKKSFWGKTRCIWQKNSMQIYKVNICLAPLNCTQKKHNCVMTTDASWMLCSGPCRQESRSQRQQTPAFWIHSVISHHYSPHLSPSGFRLRLASHPLPSQALRAAL